MNRLNLGCGFVMPDDWTNVDKLEYEGNMIMANVLEGLPFPDNHFDFVLMNHTLQMFHYDELPYVLQEVKRVMVPGGKLRILTPDLLKAMDRLINEDREFFPIDGKLEHTLDGAFARYIFWHGDTRCAFTEVSLTDLLYRNGFDKPKKSWFGNCELDSRKEESLIMEAVKK